MFSSDSFVWLFAGMASVGMGLASIGLSGFLTVLVVMYTKRKKS